MSCIAVLLARKCQNWTSVPHSPVWLSHRMTCRATALALPHTEGHKPDTGRRVCPPSTRFAPWSWRRTSSWMLLFGLCVPEDLEWGSGCRTDPGTLVWWLAHRPHRCCSRHTGDTSTQCHSSSGYLQHVIHFFNNFIVKHGLYVNMCHKNPAKAWKNFKYQIIHRLANMRGISVWWEKKMDTSAEQDTTKGNLVLL